MRGIDLRDVHKAYGVGPAIVRALDGISLTFARGDLAILVGPNGSGKSTLLNVIAGTQLADEGRVTAMIGEDGSDWTGRSARQRSRWLSLIRQDPAAGSIGALTIAENLRLATLPAAPSLLRRAIRKMSGEARCDGPSREWSRLDGSARADALSGGQRQLLAIEMAAARASDVFLMDEPTASLDGANAVACMDRAADLANRGAIVVVVTHDLALAARYGDRLIVLRDGRVAHDLTGHAKQSLKASDILSLAMDPVVARRPRAVA